MTWTVIAAGTVVLAIISRRSLTRPRSHGFPRFFAFVSILCLIVWNLPYWFRHPAAPQQIASWALLLISLWCVVQALRLFKRLGEATAPPPRSSDFHFEHTSNLITTGIYRYIRHPMYASLFYLAWGAALKHVTAATIGGALAATVFLVLTARAEESENIARFGDAYREYMKRTHVFVPYVF